jgi:hypothetical protein
MWRIGIVVSFPGVEWYQQLAEFHRRAGSALLAEKVPADVGAIMSPVLIAWPIAGRADEEKREPI